MRRAPFSEKGTEEVKMVPPVQVDSPGAMTEDPHVVSKFQMIESPAPAPKAPPEVTYNNFRFDRTPDGGIGLVGSASRGDELAIGIKITQGAAGTVAAITFSAQIELGEQFLEAVAAAMGSPMFILAAITTGGLYIYQNWKKKEAERTERHIKRHIGETQHEVEKNNQSLPGKLAKLQKLLDDKNPRSAAKGA